MIENGLTVKVTLNHPRLKYNVGKPTTIVGGGYRILVAYQTHQFDVTSHVKAEDHMNDDEKEEIRKLIDQDARSLGVDDLDFLIELSGVEPDRFDFSYDAYGDPGDRLYQLGDLLSGKELFEKLARLSGIPNELLNEGRGALGLAHAGRSVERSSEPMSMDASTLSEAVNYAVRAYRERELISKIDLDA